MELVQIDTSSAVELPAPVDTTAIPATLLDALSTPIWIWDFDLNTIYWANQAALRLWRASDLRTLRGHAANISHEMRERLGGWRQHLPRGPVAGHWDLAEPGGARPVACKATATQIPGGRHGALIECRLPVPPDTGADGPWTEAQSEAVAEDQSDLLCRFRPDGTFTYMNSAFRQYFGRYAKVILGKSFLPLLAPPDRAVMLARINALTPEHPSNSTKNRFVGPDGRVRWHRWTDLATFDDAGNLTEIQAMGRDITANELGRRLIEGQNRVLELIAGGVDLHKTLEELCLAVEQVAEPGICSVLFCEGTSLRHGAAPHLPADYCQAIDGAEIGPAAGSCGTALYTRQPVAVADIATDPLWRDHRELAAAHNLAACWSYPILGDAGERLGTFALYFRSPRKPRQSDWHLLEAGSRLVRIAIERDRKDRALREATERLRILAANVPGVVFQRLVTATGEIRYTYVSDGARDIFGLSPEEIMADASRLFSCFEPAERDRLQKDMRKASQALSHWDMELPVRATDGAKKWTHSVARPRHLPDGAVLWEGIILDTTRSKLAELAAEAAQSQLIDAIESSSEGFALFDQQDRLAIFNRRFVELYPQLADLITIGTSFEVLTRAAAERGMIGDFPGTPEDWVQRRLANRRNPGPPIQFSLPGQRFTLVSERPTVVGGLVSVHTDVTDLKRQEAETRRQSILLQSTLDNMDQGLSVFDNQLHLAAFNRRFSDVVDFPFEYARIGRPFADFVRYRAERGDYGPGQIDRLVAEQVEAARHSRSHRFERVRPDGTVLEICTNPMPGGGFVTSYTDITERQRAREALRASEERLRDRISELEDSRARLERQGRELADLAENLGRARDEAEAASRTKSEFLANMSHELRTPLNAIIGFSEVMMKELFGPLGDVHYRDYAQDVHESGSHLLDLINDILDLSKVEAGRLDLHEGPVDIGAVLSACERLMRERAHNAGITIKRELQSELPAIHADEIKLKQILLNLMSNAVKFTPRGGEVTVVAKRDESGDFLMQVRDTGIGMRPDEIPLALQPFRQIDSALSRKHAGTGLGLPLAKGLIELHGGRMSIESMPGVGTTVSIGLPASRFVAPKPSEARV